MAFTCKGAVAFFILYIFLSRADCWLLHPGSDASWSSWGPWTTTDIFNNTCIYIRNRNCSTYKFADCPGNDSDTLTFSKHCADVTPNEVRNGSSTHYWLDWSEWKYAGVTGYCLMERTRNCSNYNNSNCQGSDTERREMLKSCNELPSWTSWNPWVCSTPKDGDCVMYRDRFCPTGNKSDCLPAKSFNIQPCRAEICTDPFWSKWSGWLCNSRGGQCFMERFRNCSTGRSDDCSGSRYEVRVCDNISCNEPLWSSWSGWLCNSRKGVCFMERFRNCSTGISDDCSGSRYEIRLCDNNTCYAVPHWSSWGVWQCDIQHGLCLMKRFRTCSSNITNECTGHSYEIMSCNNTICSGWSSWTPGSCSVTCGNGTQTWHRSCIGGRSTDCIGSSVKTGPCMEPLCPVWSFWTVGKCSVTCGNGTQSSHRSCSSGRATDCPGSSVNTEPCQEPQCPVWSSWYHGPCSVTCGDGTRRAIRVCSSGTNTDCSGSSSRTEACNIAHCPATM